MPKLPAITAKKVIEFLKSNGFLLDHTTGSHFIFYNQITHRRAVVVKHNTDLPKGTLLSIIQEAGFTRNDFIKFFRK